MSATADTTETQGKKAPISPDPKISAHLSPTKVTLGKPKWLLWLSTAILCGAGAGWLAGISLSPTAGTVVAAVTGLGGAVVATLAGIKMNTKISAYTFTISSSNMTPVPIAAYIVSLSVFATLGVFARYHNWLGPSEDAAADAFRQRLIHEIDIWSSLGMDKGDVALALLKRSLASADPSTPLPSARGNADTPAIQGAGLTDVDKSLCLQLATAPDDQLAALLRGSADVRLSKLANLTTLAPVTLRQVSAALCQ